MRDPCRTHGGFMGDPWRAHGVPWGAHGSPWGTPKSDNKNDFIFVVTFGQLRWPTLAPYGMALETSWGRRRPYGLSLTSGIPEICM